MSIRPDGRPPFRADHIGSLLRPPALRQAFRRHAGKEISDGEFTRIQDGCVRDVVRMQQEIGLEVVTDGEFRRGSYWGRFVERTQGLEVRARCSSSATTMATRLISPGPMRPRRCGASSRSRSTSSCSCAMPPP